jgi:SAM-dependent methyltransferase
METANARALRERESYDTGLRRDRYDAVLGHAQTFYHPKRIQLAGEWLRPCHGGRALELGATCWANFLEDNNVFPAEQTCINISERELDKGRRLCVKTRLKPDFRVMDAQQLEFPDGHFDAVFGTAILHHVDLGRALGEIRRVLKPGGRIVFGEPLDNNPIGWLVRQLTPKARTADERPLRLRDLEQVQAAFRCRLVYEQLLSVPAGVISGALFREPDNPLTRAAFAADEWLLRAIPSIGPVFRRVLILGERH